MKKNNLLIRFFLTFFMLLNMAEVLAATNWQALKPGLEYTLLTPDYIHPWAKIHVFRFDLAQYRLAITLAKDHKVQTSTVQELVEKEHALIGVNGGFFTPELKPIGLRIQDGKTLSPLKNTSWWGIFYIQDGKPYLASPKNYPHSPNITFAVQGGPRLVSEGEIPNLKPGIAERTAIGIDHEGKVLLLATENTPLATEDLAEIMRAPLSEDGLNCANALNLDGGTSTQLFAQIGNFELNIPGYNTITDTVMVLAK
ncbi:MAG: phosphodiester glycosidase family protein [Proteobacteria bacterium]|nr:phosphodiester glycosidase family protein [Pseudomonadota bacterium]